MKFLEKFKVIVRAACGHCGGTGWIGDLVCPGCNGTGQV